MISVIISIYKRLDNLELILQGLSKQTFKDFEVIISEDNNAADTIEFLTDARKRFNFTIKHVSQEDIGFRKTRILNKAVVMAKGEYLVFLDGDCVPEKHWLKAYNKYLTPDNVCMGRRCFLKKKLTDTLLRKRTLNSLNTINILLNSSRAELGIYMPFLKNGKNHRKILGCNWGVSRQTLLDINGFDEDYTIAGVGEDHDIDWRLRKKGLTFLNIKHSVVVYHLYHKANYSESDTKAVNDIMNEKKREGLIVCKNGIKKYN
jgi:GT2 family glycosyltransferase